MDPIKILNVTTHLGGGLGTVISTYIAQSELEHSVLELEKSVNPCTDQFKLKVITLKDKKDLENIIKCYDVLLVHYYCHPLTAWALMEINRFSGNKVVVWCHNNGKDSLHPLPDNLNKITDLVILSGCKDARFNECEIIRPSALMTFLNEAANCLSKADKNKSPSFRYIGSLDKSKIHDCAVEWFSYLSENWRFDIATLDLDHHNFSKFKVLTGETKRSSLYERYFCLVYPLKENHYGCGELGLQELLMLGYPVIIRRNSVEIEIVEELAGVYFADSLDELSLACSEIAGKWNSLVENWEARSEYNIKKINLRKPYHNLDLQLLNIYKRESLRKRNVQKADSLDLVKFAYNQKTDEDLKTFLFLWNKTGFAKIPNKSSPAQFVKYFPDLKDVPIFNEVLQQS
jgi:hypothetical protein